MLVLPGDVRIALHHLAVVGLAAILEDAGIEGVEFCWTRELQARPAVGAWNRDLDWDAVADIVRRHAIVRADAADWTAAQVPGREAGLLSPRIKPPQGDAEWVALTAARRAAIDRLLEERRYLDLALIGALGEPAYWRFEDSPAGRRGDRRARRPDDGAGRWEMKTRNRGEDFVAHRLRRVALAVAARTPAQVRDGLEGRTTEDEVGKNAVDSRTATGLASPGPVDNALAWCALWGISAFPVVPLVASPSRTACHQPSRRGSASRSTYFFLPVTVRPIRLARYHQIAVSAQLATAALAGAVGGGPSLEAVAARRWLVDRHVAAVVRFPIGVFGSSSAPERRALLGEVDSLRP